MSKDLCSQSDESNSRTGLARFTGLLQKPAEREHENSPARDDQAGLYTYFFRSSHVAGNSNRTNQQPQQLKKSSQFVEHELCLLRKRLVPTQFIEVRGKILDIAAPRTKKRLLILSCR